ncbi:phage holin family protein [Actinocrispum sp. NPDC049592]|uniref:phage holin family protein n=1 Tax=Actinocrispum sp. NPDC049592 TaxID=3154835 RepID=UPI0034253593
MIEEVNKQPASERSVGQLVGDLADELKRLVRDEIKLAVLEMRTKGKKMGIGAGALGVAGVLGLLGGGTLVAAAVLAIALVMPAWLAALLVGGALVILAGLTGLVGKSQITKAVPPVPEEAVAGVREDIQAIQRGVRK